ncbi:MAG TPA: hypothetical protein VN634_19340 [Candidatus Limnocylindrales bacterium]|nr:hypothetical protein [Candidatus Limnocylindrales bacterium]
MPAFRLVLALWMTLGTVVCTTARALAIDSSASAVSARTATTAGKHLRVRYEPRPDPIPLDEPFAIRVYVEPDASSSTRTASPSGRRIEVRGWMPEHLHGMPLAPLVTPAGDGVWNVDGMLLHMTGHWQLFIDVMDDDKRDRATFDVELR